MLFRLWLSECQLGNLLVLRARCAEDRFDIHFGVEGNVNEASTIAVEGVIAGDTGVAELSEGVYGSGIFGFEVVVMSGKPRDFEFWLVGVVLRDTRQLFDKQVEVVEAAFEVHVPRRDVPDRFCIRGNSR